MLLLALLLGGAVPVRLAAQREDDAPKPLVRIVGRVTVVGRPAELNVGMALAEQADGAVTLPGLGRRQLPPFSLIVVRGSADYTRFSRGLAPAWGAAITVPSARTILLRLDAGDPLQLLRHELAHLAMHDAVRGRVPRWFDEGFATWAAGEFDRLDGFDLHLAVAGGDSLTWSSVNRTLASPVGNPSRAYALAATSVLMLARVNPTGTLTPLFDLLASGVPFDTAVLRTTGRSVDRFEEAWAKDTRYRYGALAWTLGLLPWLVILGLTVVGVVLRKRRDVPRRAALDEGWTLPEEEPSPADAAADAPLPLPPPDTGSAARA